jgi:hypothetical protein
MQSFNVKKNLGNQMKAFKENLIHIPVKKGILEGDLQIFTGVNASGRSSNLVD